MSRPRRPLSAGSWRALEREEGRRLAADVSEMKENRRPFDYRSTRFFLEVVGFRKQLHLHEKQDCLPQLPRVRPIVPVFANIQVDTATRRLLYSCRSVASDSCRKYSNLRCCVKN